MEYSGPINSHKQSDMRDRKYISVELTPIFKTSKDIKDQRLTREIQKSSPSYQCMIYKCCLTLYVVIHPVAGQPHLQILTGKGRWDKPYQVFYRIAIFSETRVKLHLCLYSIVRIRLMCEGIFL